MPSLKLSNPFRRGTDRPSLRDRAASLKASAERVIQRRPGDMALNVPPAGQRQTARPALPSLGTMPDAAAVAASVNVSSVPLPVLRSLFDVATMLGDVASAVGCQPRCSSGETFPKDHANAAGHFASWVADVCDALESRCNDEALRRRPDGDAEAHARLCILALATVENGDPREAAAFARDLKRAM